MEYLLMFFAVFCLGVFVPVACIRRYLRNVRGAELYTPLLRSLLWMLDHDGVDGLSLDFSIMEKRTRQQQVDKKVVVTDLVRNGRKIQVMDDNKDFYVERRFHYLLFESVAKPLYVFLKGIYEVVPQEMLMVLDAEELDYLLCGSDVIDVDDWKRNTKYNETIHAHPSMKWFWKHVHAMDLEHKKRLLHFTTGSSRVPIAGFLALTSSDGKLCPFTLNGVPIVAMGLHTGRSLGYVRNHACFNQLDLPLPDTRHEFRAALLAAIESGDVYGFTTS
ncbi:Hect ubiquitin ligase, partial [Globisporangium splendens]